MLAGITLIIAGLLSLIVVWVVEGLFKRQAPWGEALDYLIGLVGGVGVAALDYYVIIPAFFGANAPQWLLMGGSIMEGAAAAWLVLWLIRLAVRPPLKDEDTA